ncbi:HD domain-containing protein [Nanoarchaeota archaeon]
MEKLKVIVKAKSTDAGHDFSHTERVHKMAVLIAEDEIKRGNNVDMQIVKAVALLHDYARHKEDIEKGICHAEQGAKDAPEVLRSLGFPEEKIKEVCYAISVHRYSKGLKAETIYAQILQDADRLDALGTMAISRIIYRAGAKGKVLHDPDIKPTGEYSVKVRGSTAMNHFYDKILNIKPESFHTKCAQERARSRYEYVKNFVEQFENEWHGRD